MFGTHPPAAVFNLMLQRVDVPRYLPPFVTLRLTQKQIALPPPRAPRTTYGDYYPIAGWIKELEKALGAGPLVVGYEREGEVSATKVPVYPKLKSV